MNSLIDIQYMLKSLPEIAGYILITLLITAVSMVFGFIIGLTAALIKIYKVPELY